MLCICSEMRIAYSMRKLSCSTCSTASRKLCDARASVILQSWRLIYMKFTEQRSKEVNCRGFIPWWGSGLSSSLGNQLTGETGTILTPPLTNLLSKTKAKRRCFFFFVSWKMETSHFSPPLAPSAAINLLLSNAMPTEGRAPDSSDS
jgi:hypothetical protein